MRTVIALAIACALAFTLLPSSPASAATAEFAVNGTFANGSDGWKTNKPAVHPLTVEKVGRSGTNALVVAPKDSQTVVVNDEVDSLRNIKKGETYTLSTWVRSSTTKVSVTIRAREGAVSGDTKSFEKKVAVSGNGWQKVSLEFTTQSDAKWVDINVLFGGHAPGTKLYIDSISLTGEAPAVPEAPALPSAPGTTGNPNACTRVAPTGTTFGTSISTSSQTHAEAVAGIDALFGNVPIIRVFDPGMPLPWTHRRTEMIAGRDLVMSFRPMPQEVLAGTHDAELRAWFEQAPSNVTVYWSYIHEPEPLIDQGKFTADQYRRAWQHIDQIADSVCRTNMYSTLILTGWTTQPESKRDWRTYYPGSDVIDVMAFDPYNGVHDPARTYYATPQALYDSVRKVADEAGKPYAIAETGSRRLVNDPTGSGRAAWLTSIAKYHRDNGAVFVTYFQSSRDGEWWLLKAPETTAWANAIKSSK